LRWHDPCFREALAALRTQNKEITMRIGIGLGTLILIILIIVFLF
jgi:hypothetical protein